MSTEVRPFERVLSSFSGPALIAATALKIENDMNESAMPYKQRIYPNIRTP